MTTISDITDELAKLRSNSTFMVLHKYRNEAGEVADYNLVFHISYENALRKSIAIVEKYSPVGELATRAKAEVLLSYKSSLAKMAERLPEENEGDAYDCCFSPGGDIIKGIKVHRASGVLHLYGLVHQKRVLTPGTYRKVVSRALTVEKDAIRKLCPVGKFRQFRIVPNQLEKISVCGIELLPTVF